MNSPGKEILLLSVAVVDIGGGTFPFIWMLLLLLRRCRQFCCRCHLVYCVTAASYAMLMEELMLDDDDDDDNDGYGNGVGVVEG